MANYGKVKVWISAFTEEALAKISEIDTEYHDLHELKPLGPGKLGVSYETKMSNQPDLTEFIEEVAAALGKDGGIAYAYIYTDEDSCFGRTYLFTGERIHCVLIGDADEFASSSFDGESYYTMGYAPATNIANTMSCEDIAVLTKELEQAAGQEDYESEDYDEDDSEDYDEDDSEDIDEEDSGIQNEYEKKNPEEFGDFIHGLFDGYGCEVEFEGTSEEYPHIQPFLKKLEEMTAICATCGNCAEPSLKWEELGFTSFTSTEKEKMKKAGLLTE